MSAVEDDPRAAGGHIIAGTPQRLVAVRYVRPQTFNGLRVTPQYGSKGARAMQAGARAIVDEIADWKTWAINADRALVVPIVGPVRVEVDHLRINHAAAPDVGAPYVAAKALLDGLVKAGLLPDGDGPKVVRSLTFNGYTVAGIDGLRMTITSVPGGTPGLF